MSGAKSLVRGTSVMVVSVTLAKILGLLWIVPVTRLIHDEGMGFYSSAYTLYAFVLTLSTQGFPTAMGKLIAEKLALHKYADVEQLYRVTVRVVVLFGAVMFVFTWFGAPLYSALVAVKESKHAVAALTLSVRALAPALLVVPLMSAMRGYLQGFQKLEPSGYSQAIEQLVRVVAMIVGAYLVMHSGGTTASGAAAATFGAFVGALAGVILLLFAVVPLRRRFRQRLKSSRPTQSSREVFGTLFQYSLPVSLGSLPVPISWVVDSLTITNFLMLAGFSFSQATAAYGVLSRQAMQLIQVPLAFAMAIGVAVLPAIAEATALRDQESIAVRIRGTFRSMLFTTLPVAATLFVLGRPVDQMLFGTTEGAYIISSVAFMSIFSSLELISTYMLQGLGKMYRPVRNMFIGIFIKLILNLVLILPFHVIGAAIATTVGYLFSATLNVLAVRKYSNVRFSVWKLSVPLILASVFCCIGLLVGDALGTAVGRGFASADLRAVVQVCLGILVGGIAYVFSAIGLRAVSPQELQRIPVVGRRLVPIANRLQRRHPATVRRPR